MEKYILKGLFMLAILTIMVSNYTSAENAMDKFTTADRCQRCNSLISQTADFKNRGVINKKLNNVETAIFMVSDTGKHFRKFFFYDIPGWNKKFPDSLLSKFRLDSAWRGFRFHRDSMYKGFPRQLYPERHDNSIEMPNMIRRRSPWMPDERSEFPGKQMNPRKNSQSFIFRDTDKDGITTHIQIDVSDPSTKELEKLIANASNDALSVQDLSFSPNFSSGKVTLMFNLAGKGDLHIKVMDDDLNVIFTDYKSKFSGSYQNTLSLHRNGIYYLVITRKDKVLVKRIIKTE